MVCLQANLSDDLQEEKFVYLNEFIWWNMLRGFKLLEWLIAQCRLGSLPQ